MSLRSLTVESRCVLAIAAALTLAGCQKKPEEQAAAPEAAPAAAASEALEGQVDIVAWPGYIERG